MDLARLDLKKLHIFKLVARHGGLRPAATRLGITISGVSFSIRRLEEQLDVELFRRSPNRLILTTAGRHLLDSTEALFEGIEKTLSTSALEEIHAGRLSISVNSDLAWYFVPRISAFLKRYPDVELSISIKNSVDALRAVESGEIDMAIGLFGDVSSSIEVTPILETAMTLVCPKDHPLAARKHIRADDIAQHKLLTAGPSSARIGKARLPTRGLIEAGNCQTACELVAAGVGVGLVHTFCTHRASSHKFHFRDVSRLFGKRAFSAIYRRQTGGRPTLLKRLKDALLEDVSPA
jgi:DNA-binding transcriptional LysR family regulator